MHKLNIKVPVNSKSSALLQKQAGADQFYLGFIHPGFKNLTFSGRGRIASNRETHVSYRDFKEIIKLAHDNNIKVELTANMPMMGDDPAGTKKIQKLFCDYINRGIEAGVDSIIVGDIGNIILLKEMNYSIPITASTFLTTLNHYQILFLEELGVTKVIVPHHITLEEMKSLTSNSNIALEVFGHFGCSFLEGTCSLYHHASEEINFGIPCRALFTLDDSSGPVPVLDMGEDCSLCVLADIIDAGVSCIKIIGRELDPRLISSICYIYKYVLSLLEENKDIKDIIAGIKDRFDWWDESFCRPSRCKYLYTDYYI
jgi:U32 family peptidase